MKTELQQAAEILVYQAKVEIINGEALFTVTAQQIHNLEKALKESLSKEVEQQ